jgi:hypothetical protein
MVVTAFGYWLPILWHQFNLCSTEVFAAAQFPAQLKFYEVADNQFVRRSLCYTLLLLPLYIRRHEKFGCRHITIPSAGGSQ